MGILENPCVALSLASRFDTRLRFGGWRSQNPLPCNASTFVQDEDDEDEDVEDSYHVVPHRKSVQLVQITPISVRLMVDISIVFMGL